MKRHAVIFLRKSLCLFALLAFQTASAAEAAPADSNTANVVNARLLLKIPGHLKRLTSAQIRHSLSGRGISPDLHVRQMNLLAAEDFVANGEWHGFMDSITLVMLFGKWSVNNNNQLCLVIERSNPPHTYYKDSDFPWCRSVYKNTRTGKIFAQIFADQRSNYNIVSMKLVKIPPPWRH